jgi:hypothetical protein
MRIYLIGKIRKVLDKYESKGIICASFNLINVLPFFLFFFSCGGRGEDINMLYFLHFLIFERFATAIDHG